MKEDQIAQIEIGPDAKLYVQPLQETFPYIYRAAMEVGWDVESRRLFGPKPREWSYFDWFRQIVAAAADEYGVSLKISPSTMWVNIPTELRSEIEAYRLP
jgi:hypothetical protein